MNEINNFIINDIIVTQDVDTLAVFDSPSDHRMVREKLKIRRKSRIRNYKRERKYIKQIVYKSAKLKAGIELLQKASIIKANIKATRVQAAYNKLENEIKNMESKEKRKLQSIKYQKKQES